MNPKYANAIRKVQNMMTALRKDDEVERALFDALAAQLKSLRHYYYYYVSEDDTVADELFVEKDGKATDKHIARFVEIFG